MKKQIKRHKAMIKRRKAAVRRRKIMRMLRRVCLSLMPFVLVYTMGFFAGKYFLGRAVQVSREQKIVFLTSEMTQEEEARCYYYSLLNEKEQEAYRQILEGLRQGREDIYVNLSEPGKCNEIFGYVHMDHPEFFWCDGGSATTSYTMPKEYSVLTPNYSVEGAEREKREEEIQLAVREWIAQVPEELSEYEKIKKVYELIIERVEYNKEASDNQNIYSVFVNNQSVCAGYAKAAQHLLNQLGIFCTYVTGRVYTGEAHAWNIVKCDGEYYHVDTTWGDPVFLQKKSELGITGDEVTYDYLCCPDSELFKTHILEPESMYPKCTASEYEYYRRNGMYYETADEDVFESVLQKSIENKQNLVIFKFPNDEVYEQAYDILFGGLLEKEAQYLGRWYELNQIQYYYREEEKVDKIMIYWKYE